MDEGLFDIFYRLADTSIQVQDVGKYAESIIEYVLNPEEDVSQEVYRYIKGKKEGEKLDKKKIFE